MKLRTAPAREGLAWVRSGLFVLRRQPLAQMGMVAAMVVVLGLIGNLPKVGLVLVLLLVPALGAGWVFSSAAVQAGVRTSPARLVAALIRPRRAAMLQLGALFAAAWLLMLLLADQIDPGFSARLTQLVSASTTDATPSAAEEAALVQAAEQARLGLMLRILLLLPVLLAFWHAPVIVHRVGGSAARAVFASALTTRRNWRAFGVYALAWVAADAALSAFFTLLGLVLGPLVVLLLFPAAMAFVAAFLASIHASVHGCIDFDELRRHDANARAGTGADAAASNPDAPSPPPPSQPAPSDDAPPAPPPPGP